MSKIQTSLFGQNIGKITDLSMDSMRLKSVKISTTINRRKNLTTIKIGTIKVSNNMADDIVSLIKETIQSCAVTVAQTAKELAESNVLIALGEPEKLTILNTGGPDEKIERPEEPGQERRDPAAGLGSDDADSQ